MNESQIFLEALERGSPEERAAFLDAACGADQRLRAAVEALLQAHADDPDFLEQPHGSLAGTVDRPSAAGRAPAAPSLADSPEQAGTVLAGRYKLLEMIGEGGMGEVWHAEQIEPVQRQVALKVIKAGMDSKAVLARFEAERQALALMDHPNIAKVLDGGMISHKPEAPAKDQRPSPSLALQACVGRPYFVMELVKGVSITKYCDQHRLTPRQRLELLVPVCHAVQHAHHKGVIHRDLKPSNVLVGIYDGRPVVKVIDFGVAKAAGQKLTEKTLFTGIGSVVGTLEYMSPEQARLDNVDIDTRSDIYSLGVLLYELLTGSTPLDRKRLKEAAFTEMLRVIREEEPSKPSTKLSTAEGLPTLAANRGTEPAKLTKLVRGELDWIVMKALEKDRNRRYETANGFAMDVQRYLADEAVLACPPSMGYRFRKFARRNQRALPMAGLMVVAIVVAGGALGWAIRDREARRAEVRSEKARQQAAQDQALDQALRETALLLDRSDWPQAQAALRRAEWLLITGASESHQQRVHAMATDLKMVSRLEEIRLGKSPLGITYRIDPFARSPQHALNYAEAFKDYGIDVAALDAADAAERIRISGIAAQLVAALDDWMWAQLYTLKWPTWKLQSPSLPPEEVKKKEIALSAELEKYEHLCAVAERASSNEWCRRIRDPEVHKDRRTLEDLAARPEVAKLPPSAALFLVRVLDRAGATNKAVERLYAVQARSPDDLLVNFELAVLLRMRKPARLEEAIGFMRVAVALRPHNPTLHVALGQILAQGQRFEAAAAAYRKAIELQPSDPRYYTYLDQVLEKMGKNPKE